MENYGLTKNGPVIKRLDAIVDEMHNSLTEKLGVNTKKNQQSLLNVLITNIADQIAELWEMGLDVYYSQYPSSAEGISLDNVAQLGGSTRALAEKSYYKVLCTGVDGTKLPQGTSIASDTNPAINLVLEEDSVITREKFNKVSVIITASQANIALGAVLNGKLYQTIMDDKKNASENLQGLADIIDDENFNVSVDRDELVIEAVEDDSSNTLVLSDNLTTKSVGTVVTFATEDYGDIYIPNGVVSKINKSVAGLTEVKNVGSYIAGRLEETDAEFRASYVDKIFGRSSSMLESVRSAILENVQGVISVAPYENDTNEYDEFGRPPHSIEIVVDGGDDEEIAQQILNTKAGGISTYGNVETVLPGVYGEGITVRFNRPAYVNVWFQIGVIFSNNTNVPTNYADLIKDVIVECMESVEAGMDVVPQRFTQKLYDRVAGIDYFDIRLYSTSGLEQPTKYNQRSVTITPRQRAVTKESMIGVVIDG